MSLVNRLGVATSCLVAVLVAVIVFLPTQTSAVSSHYETYITYETQSYYRCYPFTYTYCYNWYYWNYWNWGWNWGPYYYYYNWYYWNPYYGYYGWWPCCYYQTHYDCYWNYQTVAVTRTRCQSRWSGISCDVPSCSPACGGGQICVDLDRCECANGGTSGCSMIPCSTSNNCYPGTCVSGVCKCANGFNGTNCERILQKPAISGCKVKLYAQPPAYGREVAVAEADCAAEGLEPKTAWVGRDLLNTASTSLGFTKLEPAWRADYTSPIAMPSRPTGSTSFFISNAPVVIGVSQTTFNVIFQSFTTTTYVCLTTNVNNDPVNSKLCDVATPWNNLGVTSLLTNNVSFAVNITALLGGTKKGDGTYTYNGVSYNFLPQQFTGSPITVRAKFQIDLVPPTHCLLENISHFNCVVFPIYLDQDIRTNPVIEPKFLNWTDKESGIDRYHVEVFYMASDAQNTLSPIGDALISSDITPYLNNFKFTTPRPGVYSIVLTTFDRANNSAMARKIYNFNDRPSFTTTSAPVYIQEADNNTANSFVTTIYNRKQLTLKWPGRFKTDDIYNEVLLQPVKPWTIDPYTIDDNFDSKYGMRSINAINPKNLTGISAITYRYIVDPNGGLGVEEPTDNVTWPVVSDKTAESVQLNFTEPLNDGDTVIVWLKAVDVTGNPSVAAVVKTFIDASKVEVANQTFQRNSVDQYASKVVVTAFDRESGIKGISYVIYDFLTKVDVHNSFAPATTRDPINGTNQPCLSGDATCYCTPLRTCFNYEQVVLIDHCWIDRFAGSSHRLQFKYTVMNIAGVPDSSTSTPNVLEFGDIAGLLCKATKPPTPVPKKQHKRRCGRFNSKTTCVCKRFKSGKFQCKRSWLKNSRRRE